MIKIGDKVILRRLGKYDLKAIVLAICNKNEYMLQCENDVYRVFLDVDKAQNERVFPLGGTWYITGLA